ncbi:hypothetical protein K3495_g4696 [Podosphaera aphanis]|nr:hypothetical protein K3495_g4696 [Podosphaera aphanis]
MVQITDRPVLSPEDVTLYYTTDSNLENLPVLVFHGPSTISNSTLNSSRIQVHIFTGAGFQSYERITISPNSPFYQSVNHLPREKQGDEVCRGIAFGLLKYFKELPETAKNILMIQHGNIRGKRSGTTTSLFGEQHAAALAGSMVKVENTNLVINAIQAAFRPQNINHIDLDLVLPPGSIVPAQTLEEHQTEDGENLDSTLSIYGNYAPLIKLFGEITFLPTSNLKRAPSRPTSINRTRSFLKDQKISLRREMAELVDTEERYVIKLHELVHHIANEFREKAKNRAPSSLSPSEEDLIKLFPKSLDQILQVNTAFLNQVRKVMDDTEEDAMQDLEATAGSSTSSRYGGTGRLKDPTGALSFAKTLVEWFPQFSDCYQEYIRASQNFPQIITSFVKQQSSFSKRLQQAGEQRLRSAVIEPVQRLPRYSLFIDNIVNNLPALHPAMQLMLKARDIITSICSMDPPEPDKSQVINRLQNLVENWPSSLIPEGRLVTAVDFLERPTSYDTSHASDYIEGVLLLFTDRLVFTKKSSHCNLSARGLLAEIDKPSASTIMAFMAAKAGAQKNNFDLSFCSENFLSKTRFTTSDDGHSISMTSLHEPRGNIDTRGSNMSALAVRVFLLQGGYEGKGLKLTEEITKARIEARFSEAERETNEWSCRSMRLATTDITFHSAIFQEGVDTLVEGRRDPAPIRIVIDHNKGTKRAPVGHYGVEIVSNVFTLKSRSKYRLEVDGLNDKVFVDELDIENFLPTLAKRIVELLRSQNDVRNSNLTVTLISSYTRILKSLEIQCESDKQRLFKPGSPVKMLSNLFNNSTTGSISGSKTSKTSSLANVPSLTRTNSNKSIQSTLDVDSRISYRASADEKPDNHLIRLEETFAGYIAALCSCKGNVIGRALRNRAMTDELAVNALYNTFIENPFDQRAASEVTVDIIFVAFEKYLRIAWRDQMGDVIPLQTWDELQIQAIQLAPGEFVDYVRLILSEMTPQNRRALIGIIKLLADLLDGCGNDGDRGAMTAAFAELLVLDGNPHDYINLLDRLVLDHESLFDVQRPVSKSGIGAARSYPYTPNSITSSTSSFRRKFADTVLRQNSTIDKSSVWRSLSKNNRNPANGEYANQTIFFKKSPNRSQSIESSRRPALRDRPTILGAFEERPSSSSESGAKPASIEVSSLEDKKDLKALKKKRRSSLSDLKTILSQATLGSPVNFSAIPSSRNIAVTKSNSSPQNPPPSRIPVAGGVMERSRSSMYRTGSPTQRENNPPNSLPNRSIGSLSERSQNVRSTSPITSDVFLIKDLWTTPHKKSASNSSSNIPNHPSRPPSTSTTLNYTAGNHGTPKSPQKLRLQSPHKLRERLQNEAKAIKNAEAEFRSELDNISAELSKLQGGDASLLSQQKTSKDSLSNSLQLLLTRFRKVIADLKVRNNTLELDLEKSVQALELKLKGLEQLYRETMAENELLYERFNGELAKIVKAVKAKVDSGGGSGVRDACVNAGRIERIELVEKVREATEETAIMKRENARLKREILTLRVLLKGGE